MLLAITISCRSGILARFVYSAVCVVKIILFLSFFYSLSLFVLWRIYFFKICKQNSNFILQSILPPQTRSKQTSERQSSWHPVSVFLSL